MSEKCWNEIGYIGDRSCPDLADYNHCFHCPVFARAGQSLLDREPQPDYLEENSNGIAEAKKDSAADSCGAVVFRISHEWLALPSKVFSGVLDERIVRPVPHKSGRIFKGLATVQGQIVPVVSIRELLGLDPEHMSEAEKGFRVYRRHICVDGSKGHWIFGADEVLGVVHYFQDALMDVPATVAKAPAAMSQGLFDVGERRVSLLSDELFFTALNRSVK